MRIEIQNIAHQYHNGQITHALTEVNLHIHSGQFIALIGPSGCGKSTLLRLIAGLIHPSHGSITLDHLSPQQAVSQQSIAWMAQSPALLPWLTVQGNLELALRFVKRTSTSTEAILEQVGLSEAANQYPLTLSGGMQQRLALARVLAQNAPVWLMDEPFAALDEITRDKLTHEFMQLWRTQQPTVLWVTHNIYEAVKLANRILVFSPKPGRILADIPNTLPQPRNELQPGFLALVQQLRSILHTEPGDQP
ncbi:MAG: heme ABC exporter ATP-binding protein CcmA [Chloroflexi bacterium HGW-Chloroflexi-10]|nr:MAG: heme ABC exporter ATP-binding protein CcmA [Chloroflexi bacterium HGW-Chloroflexi-10]